ncbi:hypothetical protein Ancab_039579 [Ancistrocladus abbreviatus]
MGQFLTCLRDAAYAAMSIASAHSGSISEGKDPREFDSDAEYQDFCDRARQIVLNLWVLRAKLEDQVFLVFEDQVHYTETAVVAKGSVSDIEMELQRAREWKVPTLRIHQPCQIPVVYRLVQTSDTNIELLPVEEPNKPTLEIRPSSPVKQQERSVEETELRIAASAGHVEDILQILHRNIDLIANADSNGDLPLHEAARAGQLEAVMTLTLLMTRYGKPELSIGKANKEGNTALHLALQNGHEKVAWYLIRLKPETSHSLNEEGISPLYLAIETRFQDLVRYILIKISSRKCLNQTSPKNSVIHAAIRAQDNVILKTVLKKLCPMVNSFDEEGQTPLSCAAYIGYLDGVIFILDKYPESAFCCNKDGSYPIHKASGRDHVEIVEQFLLHFPETIDLPNGHDQNILHVAAMRGNTKTVSYLLKMQGIKKLMDMRDRDGNTALHLAAMNEHLDMVSCLEDAGKCHP